MIGLGTLANAAAIVLGGLIGMVARRFLSERIQETMIKAMGFAVMAMALGSIIAKMLTVSITQTETGFAARFDTQGTIMMIVSLAGGALIGEIINFERRFERVGMWLRDKSGSKHDGGFIDAFMTASLTVCVGAMAVIGSIQDGLSGDHNTLFAKALIDFVIIMMMAAAMGKGCLFSAIPILVIQGSITILAKFIAPVLTEAALDNISYVGNVLILCVGMNLIHSKTIRVANLLPAIIIAVLFAL